MKYQPEDWWIVCVSCGHEKRAIDAGLYMKAARGKRYKLIHCSQCNKYRIGRIEPRKSE